MLNALKEPIFNTLRTQEQLGYIVNAAKTGLILVPLYTITVQSSTYDADYLESRINAFFEAWKDWQPKEEEVKSACETIINKLK